MIKYIVEKLFHFQCGNCNKWWSVGDFHEIQTKTLCCPFCSSIQAVQKGKMEVHKD